MSNCDATGSFLQLLRADLGRQFFLEGTPEKKVTLLQLLLRALHPRFLPLVICRCSRSSFLLGIPVLPFLLSYFNLVFFGIQVTPRCEIGPGLFLPHTSGTVIGAWRLGCNVTVFQGVTLGSKELDFGFSRNLLPDIGHDVTIGSGAKILGGIRIEDGVVVGANSVVLKSVEKRCTVAGIPAREIEQTASHNLE